MARKVCGYTRIWHAYKQTHLVSAVGSKGHVTLKPRSKVSLQAFDEVIEEEVEANALEIYTAVKPSGREKELQQELPELRARLHPHQRRAAAWMVDRETGQAVRSPRFKAVSALNLRHARLWSLALSLDRQINDTAQKAFVYSSQVQAKCQMSPVSVS